MTGGAASCFRFRGCARPLPSQNGWAWLASPGTGPAPPAKPSGRIPGNTPSRPKPAVAPGDPDGVDVARPRMAILEPVAADRLQVVEVEITRRHGPMEVQGDQLARCRFEHWGAPDRQPVAENGVVRRTAAVSVAPSAAATRPRSSIRRGMWARRRSDGHPSRPDISDMAFSSAQGRSRLPRPSTRASRSPAGKLASIPSSRFRTRRAGSGSGRSMEASSTRRGCGIRLPARPSFGSAKSRNR